MLRCACDTRPGRPARRVAREAIEAAAAPRCKPGMDRRRNRADELKHTDIASSKRLFTTRTGWRRMNAILP